MTPIKTIIFDLDGTLIDSSKSILAGFSAAFDHEGIAPTRTLSPEIIGPPLRETLTLLAGTADAGLIDRLAERFKSHYDTEGYKETTVFEGVPEMLSMLHASGIPLHIATNKRLTPTLRILDHLGWRKFFVHVRALDAWNPPARNKAEMIARLLSEARISNETALYVGDRQEDRDASLANLMPFALAAWGYGNIDAAAWSAEPILAQPQTLHRLVNAPAR